MNAWTIYWILQLDSIVGLCVAIGVIGGISTVAFGMVYMLNADWQQGVAATGGKWCKRSFIAAAIALTVGTFIPSSKTAAAMVIIPAIANNEAIRTEASDLYALAKQALREAVTDEPKRGAK